MNINYIKKIKRKPVYILLWVLILALAAFLIFPVATNDQDREGLVDNEELQYDLVLQQHTEDDLRDKVEQFIFTGQYSEAEKLIRHQQDFGSNADSHRLLIMVLLEKGDMESAYETAKEIAEFSSIDGYLARQLGDLAAKAGRSDEAKKYYELSITIMKENYEDYAIPDNEIAETEYRMSQL